MVISDQAIAASLRIMVSWAPRLSTSGKLSCPATEKPHYAGWKGFAVVHGGAFSRFQFGDFVWWVARRG